MWLKLEQFPFCLLKRKAKIIVFPGFKTFKNVTVIIVQTPGAPLAHKCHLCTSFIVIYDTVLLFIYILNRAVARKHLYLQTQCSQIQQDMAREEKNLKITALQSHVHQHHEAPGWSRNFNGFPQNHFNCLYSSNLWSSSSLYS